MKHFLIKLLIDYIMDALESVLARLSKQTGNTVDDDAVKVISDNRDQIKDMIKAKL